MKWPGKRFPQTRRTEKAGTAGQGVLGQVPGRYSAVASVQNTLNRKSDLAVEYGRGGWTESDGGQPLLVCAQDGRRGGDEKAAEWIVANDPKNFWGDYLLAVAEMQKEKPDLKYIVAHFESALVREALASGRLDVRRGCLSADEGLG